MSTADGLTSLRRAYELARLSEQWSELSEFLRYYLPLRRDVLLGRRQATSPLGIRYRWRQWQYEQHVRQTRERDWQQ